MIIGGYHGRRDEDLGISSDVWAFSDILQNNAAKITLLNSLNEARMKHSCGLLKNAGGNLIAVVAGGFNGFESLNSVEILQFNEAGAEGEGGIYSKWKLQTDDKKIMPLRLHGGSFLPNEDCTKLHLVGGKSLEKGILDTIMILDGTLQWKFATYNMTRRRSDFVITRMTNEQCMNFG